MLNTKLKNPPIVGKAQLCEIIAEKSGIAQKDVEKVWDTYHKEVMLQVSEGKAVRIIGFGRFFLRRREKHKARNPQTGRIMTIPARYNPTFKFGTQFKKLVQRFAG